MGEKPDLQQLAKTRLEYELLTNELFHLREFTSLVDFDPLYRNTTDSFRNFLEQKNLDVETRVGADDLKESNASRRLKRRHASAASGADAACNDKWSQVQNFVDAEYSKLEDSLKSSGGPRRRKRGIDMTGPGVAANVIDTEEVSKVGKRRPATPSFTETTRSKTSRRKPVTAAASTPAAKNESTMGKNLAKSKATVPSKTKPKSKSKPVKSQAEIVTPVKKTTSKPKSKSKVNNVVNDMTTTTLPDDIIEDEEYYFTTSSEEEEDVDHQLFSTKRRKFDQKPRPRVKIHVHPPTQTITNNLHVVEPEFKNVDQFLQSFKSLDEDLSLEEYDAYIKEQRKVASLIRTGFERGAIKYDPITDSLQSISLKDVMPPSNFVEPLSMYYKEQTKHTFQDHLINQGIVLSRSFQESRRTRMAKSRRIAQIVESYFKHVAGAEERKLKEEEKRKKNLARVAMQAVKKRWTMAEKAYRVLKKDEMDRLDRIQGKKNLTEMLEQSTQLLGAQLNQLEASAATSNISDSETNISTNNLDSDDDDDDVMSSSSSDSEEETGIERTENDMELSVEELRLKYAKLDSLSAKESIQESVSSPGDESIFDEVSDSASDSMEDSTSSSDVDDSGEESVPHEETPGLSALLGNMDDKEDEPDVDAEFDAPSSSYEEAERESSEEADLKAEELPSPPKSDIDYSEGKTPNNDGVEDPLAVADVPVPSLLRGTLREYQKQGLNWLASLYNNKTNGILADEMGLGKTIQTISLLAYLACEKQNWGPHLIVVPTSVLLNWEMEFKRFAPGFKVLTYYGSPQQRREKRKGWNKPDAFHVCITSYQLVVHDQHSFKRKKWQYMILDEAHNIKNFRSTRWQALLNFNAERRLLLTGTPLQNNLAEFWSLLYFLMPQTALENGKISGFADLDAFQQWFGRPVDKIVETGENYEQDEETKNTVSKLHQVLRPYLLRRLKADVEKQMPGKYEHIIYCRLSKRQRFLYDDFMSRAQTKETLASGNFMSIINCLMQLRKVCNHPDLFEVRPILTSFCMENSVTDAYCDLNNYIYTLSNPDNSGKAVDLFEMNLQFTSNDFESTTHHSEKIRQLQCTQTILHEMERLQKLNESEKTEFDLDFQDLTQYYSSAKHKKVNEMINHLKHLYYLNRLRCERKPMYGSNVIDRLTLKPKTYIDCDFADECIKPLQTRLLNGKDIIEKFAVITPSVVTLDIRERYLGLDDDNKRFEESSKQRIISKIRNLDNPFHQLQTKLSVAFPDKSLLQYDCGKLQKLAVLLQNLKDNGHRALIFTQMTKVLDILEQFLNFHGYLYMRLDGSTKIEDRQILTERFNTDPRVTVFILSSRSGGLGINLTGADTVIFYDSDWNPAMDKQCQDRCHRIGQTRDVHIYRFVSEHTIESNILKKANQKRHLDNVVIQTGDFTTDYFTKLSVKDLLGADAGVSLADDKPLLQDEKNLNKLLAQAEDEDDAKAAKSALREVNVDNEDFQETTADPRDGNSDDEKDLSDDEYGGTAHVEEYMIRFIANGFYY